MRRIVYEAFRPAGLTAPMLELDLKRWSEELHMKSNVPNDHVQIDKRVKS